MDPLYVVIIAFGIIAAAIFNYYLNWAPGADPEDFRVGPRGSGITCDCSINALILGVVVVAGLMVVSPIFESRIQLYLIGFMAFIIVTVAGLLGRKRRHNEWLELERLFHRAIPEESRLERSSTDPTFREFEDDE